MRERQKESLIDSWKRDVTGKVFSVVSIPPFIYFTQEDLPDFLLSLSSPSLAFFFLSSLSRVSHSSERRRKGKIRFEGRQKKERKRVNRVRIRRDQSSSESRTACLWNGHTPNREWKKRNRMKENVSEKERKKYRVRGRKSIERMRTFDGQEVGK